MKFRHHVLLEVSHGPQTPSTLAAYPQVNAASAAKPTFVSEHVPAKGV